jgi:uncharacterized membrane protein
MAILDNEKDIHFNYYKLFWAFVIFSVLGFVFESVTFSLWYNKPLVFRGLIYGPFSQVYGFGAVLIIAYSRLFKNRGKLFFFVSSAFLGTVYEYLCSASQEAIFGFVTWHYNNMLLNINGRTSIPLALFWGLSGMLIVKYLFPFFSRLIDKVPVKLSRVATWLMIIFISFDLFITAAAFTRQGERLKNIAATNSFQVFLDNQYPDSFMKSIKPGLQVKK